MNPEAVAEVIVSTVKQAIAPALARLMKAEERIASLESRPVIPGPPGEPGAPGKDGEPGAPGQDGLGFDDLSLDYDGERTLAFSFTRGEHTKTFPVILPFLKYQGPYQHGFAYVIGDVVTSGGAAWHCQQPTTLKPGESVSAWRLMVRKGRDGKDARELAEAK